MTGVQTCALPISTHREDIKKHNDIFLPAGGARVSFIDARDIGEAGAMVLKERGHENKSYTLTGKEALTYREVAEILSRVLGRKISYSSPSPLHFRRVMLERGIPEEFVNVMVALYLTTRLGLAKKVTPDLSILLGRSPTTAEVFLRDHAHCWL